MIRNRGLASFFWGKQKQKVVAISWPCLRSWQCASTLLLQSYNVVYLYCFPVSVRCDDVTCVRLLHVHKHCDVLIWFVYIPADTPVCIQPTNAFENSELRLVCELYFDAPDERHYRPTLRFKSVDSSGFELQYFTGSRGRRSR